MHIQSKWKRLAVIAAFILSAAAANACFWVSGTTYQGHSKSASGIEDALRLRSFLRMDHHTDGGRMGAARASSANFNDRSDYAVSLVYLGKVKEAVDLLRRLEQEQPGTYVV